ncbi:MAG: hypothetical protein ACJ0GZ_04500 [Alphaproteobacteria bacterium]
MPGLKIFDDLIKSKISSPFWRYYITSFIFIHWKIWLVMFGNDDDKINKISNIITPLYDTYKELDIFNFPVDIFMFLFINFLSFAYISIYPAIVSIAILFCLRWVEKISAPWHEKHRKKVNEIVNNSQTALESLKTKITHQKIALDHYIKKLEALQKNGDKSISDKLELFIIEYLLKNEKKQKLDELISNITSEITKEDETITRENVGNGIIYLETKKFIGSTENNNYAYNITSDGIDRLRELYKNQDISKERAEIKKQCEQIEKQYEQIIFLSNKANIDEEINQEEDLKIVKTTLDHINYKENINLDFLMQQINYFFKIYKKGQGEIYGRRLYDKEYIIIYCLKNELIEYITNDRILKITEKGKEFMSN